MAMSPYNRNAIQFTKMVAHLDLTPEQKAKLGENTGLNPEAIEKLLGNAKAFNTKLKEIVEKRGLWIMIHDFDPDI